MTTAEEMVMPAPQIDLKAQCTAIEDEVRAAMDRVLASEHFILGPEVEALEREIAAPFTLSRNHPLVSWREGLRRTVVWYA